MEKILKALKESGIMKATLVVESETYDLIKQKFEDKFTMLNSIKVKDDQYDVKNGLGIIAYSVKLNIVKEI